MIRRIVALMVVGLLVWLVQHLDLLFTGMVGARMALMLGFLLLASYLVGVIGERFKLPRITGYIIAGVVFGPSLVGFLSEEERDSPPAQYTPPPAPCQPPRPPVEQARII